MFVFPSPLRGEWPRSQEVQQPRKIRPRLRASRPCLLDCHASPKSSLKTFSHKIFRPNELRIVSCSGPKSRIFFHQTSNPSLARDHTWSPQQDVSRSLIQSSSRFLSRKSSLHPDQHSCIWAPHSHIFKSTLHPDRYSCILAQPRITDRGVISSVTRNVSPSRSLPVSDTWPTFTTQVSCSVQVSCLLPYPSVSHSHSKVLLVLGCLHRLTSSLSFFFHVFHQ